MANQMMSVVSAPSVFPTSLPEVAPLWDASGTLAAAGIDKNFVISAGNLLQTLFGLSSLTRVAADDASKVREYADLTDKKLQALSELMRPILWDFA